MNVSSILKRHEKEEEPSVKRYEVALFLVQCYIRYCDEEKDAGKVKDYTNEVKAQGKKKIMLDIGRVLGIKISENILPYSEIAKADKEMKLKKVDEALWIVRSDNKKFLDGSFSNSSYMKGYEETLAEVQAWVDFRKNRRE